MTNGQLKRELLRALDVPLANAGFHRLSDNAYGDRYCRDVGAVQHCIGIGTRRYLKALETQVGSASVRFNAVEDLVASLEDPHPLIKPEDIAARPTLVSQISTTDPIPSDPLHRWGGTATKLWLIQNQAGIIAVASEMATFALEKAEPIFSSLSNLDQALSILSEDNQRSRSYSGPDEARAKRAIALAFLTRGEGSALEMAKTKLTRLKGDARSEVIRWTKRLCQFEKDGSSGKSRSD